MSEPRIAVITPYYKEPVEMLAHCHRSVTAQGVGADHFMVADGHPLDIIDAWDVSHVKLNAAHADNGNTPRGIGSLLARQQGYDFIAYLDADNWYHDGHLPSLLRLWEKRQSAACSSFRTFHDAAGNDLNIQEPAEDEFRHVDTSCLLLHSSGFECLTVWLDMPKLLGPVCDRVFLAALLHRKLKIFSTRARTLAFRTQYRYHFDLARLPVPEGAKGDEELQRPTDYMLSLEGVSDCVRTLGFWPPTYVR
jgi:hypothetical protein